MTERLFIKQKIVDYNSLLDMKEDMDGDVVKAQISNLENPDGTLDKGVRSTDVKNFVNVIDYPDITDELIQLVNMWNPYRHNDDFIVNEFNYLIYNVGDHFRRHRDRIITPGHPLRIYSTSTLISQSEDFEGGELIVYDENDNSINTDLKVGETVFFDSMTPHQVNPVTKGTREVLVAWIFYKQDVLQYKNRI